MTRNEFITELCKREGKKRQALDAGQAREVLAMMRAIIGEGTGVDLYEVITGKNICSGRTQRGLLYVGHRWHNLWRNGKPVK